MKKILTSLYIKTKTLTGDLRLSANEIAKFVGGTVVGDGSVKIKNISALALAREGDITFAASEEQMDEACGSKASCILTAVKRQSYSKPVILVDDIKRSLVMMYNAMLEIKPPGKGAIHPNAVISDKTKLGKNVSVGPFAVIEDNVTLGDNTVIGANCFIGEETTIGEASRIYPNVTIYSRTEIGKKVTIHSGAVIGSDGFGYVPQGDKIYKVPQIGNVVIEDNVEIGAVTCIDRGTFEQTVIGANTKIDNLVQIAHNVKIGKNVLIAAQTGIAGSSSVGDNTMMGGQTGVADHIKIGKNVKVAAKTGIHGKVEDDKVVAGHYHREAGDNRKLFGIFSVLLKHSRKFRKFLKNLPEE